MSPFGRRRARSDRPDLGEARRIGRERVAEVLSLGRAELARYEPHVLVGGVLGSDDHVYAHELNVFDGGAGAFHVSVAVYAQDPRTRK